jgi:GxxExxY protein
MKELNEQNETLWVNRKERKEGAEVAKTTTLKLRSPKESTEVARKTYNTDVYENKIAEAIKNAALHVHRNLGPGLLESAYEECLAYTLIKNGWNIKRQHPMPLLFEEVKMDIGYRVDLIVEDKVIIEVKAVEKLNDVHLAQVLTYLKLSGCKLGLLINFHSAKVMDGFRRIVNNL